MVFQKPARVAANCQLLFETASRFLVSPIISDFFFETKLLKSIVIEATGGKAGGLPLSFLHPTKMLPERIKINNITRDFFIILKFSCKYNNKGMRKMHKRKVFFKLNNCLSSEQIFQLMRIQLEIQNKRIDYIDAFRNIVNWEEVEKKA
jgi:hypothetical protein